MNSLPGLLLTPRHFFTETYDTLAALRQLFRVWLKNGTARLSNSSWLSVTIQQTFVYGRHSNTMRGKWWKNHLSPVSTTRVHGPSSRPSTRVHFLTPVNSGIKKCTRVHGLSTRPVNLGRELGPWTRVVETGLNSLIHSLLLHKQHSKVIGPHPSVLRYHWLSDKKWQLACKNHAVIIQKSFFGYIRKIQTNRRSAWKSGSTCSSNSISSSNISSSIVALAETTVKHTNCILLIVRY